MNNSDSELEKAEIKLRDMRFKLKGLMDEAEQVKNDIDHYEAEILKKFRK